MSDEKLSLKTLKAEVDELRGLLGTPVTGTLEVLEDDGLIDSIRLSLNEVKKEVLQDKIRLNQLEIAVNALLEEHFGAPAVTSTEEVPVNRRGVHRTK